MSTKKIAHLGYIKDTIKRMSDHSFSVKGWAVALIAATFALADRAENPEVVTAGYYVIPVIWILDGYYLLQERRYRNLYNRVRHGEEKNVDFDMTPAAQCPCETLLEGWVEAIFSPPLIVFYVSLVVLVYAVGRHL